MRVFFLFFNSLLNEWPYWNKVLSMKFRIYRTSNPECVCCEYIFSQRHCLQQFQLYWYWTQAWVQLWWLPLKEILGLVEYYRTNQNYWKIPPKSSFQVCLGLAWSTGNILIIWWNKCKKPLFKSLRLGFFLLFSLCSGTSLSFTQLVLTMDWELSNI